MAKKKVRKSSLPTRAYNRKPKPLLVTDTTYETLKKSYDIYNHSNTAHYVERLMDLVITSNIQLSTWEIDQLNDFIEKFNAKYNSPLAKALK